MIRMMEEKDIPQICILEQQCFSDNWKEAMISEAIKQQWDTFFVLENNGRAAGYCNIRILAGEGEILRIAVAKEERGKGYGKKLMETMVDFARAQGVADIFLEVRAGNKAAINLYKTYGFRNEAVRKAYYHSPTEDACIMRKREF